jgi:hypothetical protein
MTVSWRRSALSRCFGSGAGADCILNGGGGDHLQHFAAMPERNTNVLEVLIGQIAQDAYVVDPVIGKALGVLGHAQ